MINKKMAIILVGGLAAVIAILVLLFSPSPEKSLEKFIGSWEDKEYTEMYQLLTTDSRGKHAEDVFTTKYKNIDDGIGLTKLEVKNVDKNNIKKDGKGRTIVPYTLSMETAAGKIESQYKAALVKEGMNYKIDWDESLIFPQMTPGDKISVVSLEGKRGEILDRNGKKLAENGSAYSAGFVPGKITNREEAVKKFSEITGVSVESIEKALNQKWVTNDHFVPITKFSLEEAVKKDQLLKIAGVKINNTSSRVYPYKEIAAHLTGYLGNINQEELEKLKSEGYAETDLIGKTGLERSFEKRLRSSKGFEIFIKSAEGLREETIKITEPSDGEDIKLTIDIELQKALYEEMKSDSGAATALNPKTGEVLAIVSLPAYDPNKFVLGISPNDYKQLTDDPKKPLIAKYGNTYVPGSAFKPVTAAIGLKVGAIKPDLKIDIKGKSWQDNPAWGNYSVTRVADPGKPVDLKDALIYSDNIYFAKAALDIGGQNFAEESKNFGIGESIEFPLNINSSQLVGKEGFGDKRAIALADTGYGQGAVLISPFQVASIFTSFVNGGNMIKPVLEGKDEKSKVWHEKIMSAENAKLILDDLAQVVDNPNGTGHEARISGISLAGKTGTAELKASKGEEGTELGWFTLLNTDNPKILITMMIEDVNGRGGSHYVVPKVKKVMEKFIK